METSFEMRRSASIGEPAQHLQRSMISLIKDEINLVRLEFTHQIKSMKTDAVMVVLCATLAVLSVLPLLAAAVIGLGWLLDGSFGWSALIVGAAFLLIGGGGAALFANRLMKKDFSFPRSRAAFQGGFDGNAEFH